MQLKVDGNTAGGTSIWPMWSLVTRSSVTLPEGTLRWRNSMSSPTGASRELAMIVEYSGDNPLFQ